MPVLAIVLVTTNLITLAALVALYRLIDGRAAEPPDALVAAALDAGPAPSSSETPTARTRRLISIEVLNPLELAGSRGRLAGLAGSIAPRLTRRIVNDQVLKILREQLVEQQVVADVRSHTLRSARRGDPDGAGAAVATDEVAPVEWPDPD